MRFKSKFTVMAFLLVALPVIVTVVVFIALDYYQFKEIAEQYGTGIEYNSLIYVLAILGVLLVSFISTMILYNQWIRPINRLNEAMKMVSEGNLDFSIEAKGKDELSVMCNNFEEMRKRLKDSLEEKQQYDKESRELISNISHDLKTPMTAIKGYVEGIMDGVADTPEKVDKYIKTVYNKANDMDRLINELSIYSKIDTNRIPYNFHRINVNDYFSDCVEEVGLDLEAKGIEFSYINDVRDNVIIVADPEQMRRVINNIIGNSVKYMSHDNGKISMKISDISDSVKIELSDNGKGISTEDLPNIFDRFYRTDSSRNSSQGGSGIGLSIVKKIIEDHSGYIWATSSEGEGTTMHIVLKKYIEEVS